MYLEREHAKTLFQIQFSQAGDPFSGKFVLLVYGCDNVLQQRKPSVYVWLDTVLFFWELAYNADGRKNWHCSLQRDIPARHIF